MKLVKNILEKEIGARRLQIDYFETYLSESSREEIKELKAEILEIQGFLNSLAPENIEYNYSC
jgi:predicted CopG family antitoxin